MYIDNPVVQRLCCQKKSLCQVIVCMYIQREKSKIVKTVSSIWWCAQISGHFLASITNRR